MGLHNVGTWPMGDRRGEGRQLTRLSKWPIGIGGTCCSAADAAQYCAGQRMAADLGVCCRLGDPSTGRGPFRYAAIDLSQAYDTCSWPAQAFSTVVYRRERR